MAIQIRRSNRSGKVPTSLQPGEWAANTTDGRVWIGLEGGLVMEVGADSAPRTGEMVLIAGAVPGNALTCDGSEVNRQQYALLFGRIGISYGAGDTVNTFNLPDKRRWHTFSAGSGAGQSLCEPETRERVCIFI
ncbi:phage tail protein [uncultured Endozoicomonas sp.]|uniref:phage tail protein n=1 Tax=uncultured Endozoicomonas sp. TaxID=432652 RepID=UPI00261F5A16|nr:phage tail protein [uncultured Endozoicomonas sp.]